MCAQLSQRQGNPLRIPLEPIASIGASSRLAQSEDAPVKAASEISQPISMSNTLSEPICNQTVCFCPDADHHHRTYYQPSGGPPGQPWPDGRQWHVPHEGLTTHMQDMAYFAPTDQDRKKQHWRFKGYPAFATFLASSADALVVRRFDQLQARILLMLQDEIVMLETELFEEDQNLRRLWTRRGLEQEVGSSSFRKDAKYQAQRQNILYRLSDALQRYSMP